MRPTCSTPEIYSDVCQLCHNKIGEGEESRPDHERLKNSTEEFGLSS